jgi:hypothetical protein
MILRRFLYEQDRAGRGDDRVDYSLGAEPTLFVVPVQYSVSANSYRKSMRNAVGASLQSRHANCVCFALSTAACLRIWVR